MLENDRVLSQHLQTGGELSAPTTRGTNRNLEVTTRSFAFHLVEKDV
jgi:hypothetical protein